MGCDGDYHGIRGKISMDHSQWELIRSEYEEGIVSVSSIATKYDIAPVEIYNKSNSDGWDKSNRRKKPQKEKDPSTPIVRDINDAVRTHMAIKLYLEERPSWDEIAARCGYHSRGAAHTAVKKELSRCITHDVMELREEELFMIQQLQTRCYRVATDKRSKDWTWAIDRFVALSKRKSELMGMDAKTTDTSMSNLMVIREIPNGYFGNTNVEAIPNDK